MLGTNEDVFVVKMQPLEECQVGLRLFGVVGFGLARGCLTVVLAMLLQGGCNVAVNL